MSSRFYALPLSLILATQIGTLLCADEAAIREAVRSYVAAFNRGDAAAVAGLWAEDGEWISPGGDRVQGRAAIQAEMEAYFAEGGAFIEVIDPKIRLLAPTVAVEEGQARVTRRGELPSETTYIAIHVKGDDGWKLNSVRETALPAPESNFDKLRELDWMIGTWVDQDENATIATTCRWTKNRNFLTRSFTVAVDGKIELEGTQVIGYDAANDRIRSWVFDTAGGFADGIWTRDGNRWLVKNSQTLRDGRRASSINIITYVDDNTCTWASTGREIDGELQPNVDPVIVQRVVEGAAAEVASTSDSEAAGTASAEAEPNTAEPAAAESKTAEPAAAEPASNEAASEKPAEQD